MPGRRSQSKPLQYVGLLVAIAAIVGYVGFGWRWGESNGPVPLAIAGACAVVAVGWEFYRRT